MLAHNLCLFLISAILLDLNLSCHFLCYISEDVLDCQEKKKNLTQNDLNNRIFTIELH